MQTSPQFKTFAAALLLIIGTAFHTQAATFTVTNTADAGPGSLRQAVLDANAATTADTIVFDPAVFSSPQTITLATEIAISPNSNIIDTLTITGPGANLLTVSGNNAVRIFRVGQGDTATISGMTLTQGTTVGAGAAGSAIDNDGHLTVINTTFSSNTAGWGGAIANGLSLTVTGCTFTDNTATSGSATGLGGGAIYSNTSGTVSISDSTFTGNDETGGSGGGGAVRNRGGTMNISTSTFTSNTAIDGGGAVQNNGVMIISGCTLTGNTTSGSEQNSRGGAISNGHHLTVINTLVTGNTALRHGGGVNHGGTNAGDFLQITDSTISNNIANTGRSATGYGGGIYVEGNPGTTITGSTISGNTVQLTLTPTENSRADGAGLWSGGQVIMDNCTVSSNTAELNFGGVRIPHNFSDSTVTNSTIVNNSAVGFAGGLGKDHCGLGCRDLAVGNTIIANNTAPSNPDIRNPKTTHSTAIRSLGYNLIEVTDGAEIVLTSTDLTGVNPNLSPLQDNGGGILTHAPQPGSPVIDKGKRLSDRTTDQRGVTRPTDDAAIANAEGGDGSEIGAYEIGELPVRTAQVWVDIVGRTTLRRGFPQTYHIVFGNRGGVDSPAAIARAYVTTGVIQMKSVAPLPDGSKPLILENENGTTSVIFFVPKLAAGATHTQTMKLVSPVDVEDTTSRILVRLRSSQGVEAAAYPTDADPTAELTFIELLENTETSVRARIAANSSTASGEIDYWLSTAKTDTAEPFSATVTPTADGLVYTSSTTRPAKEGSGFDRISLTATMSEAAAEVLRSMRIDRQAQAKFGYLAQEAIKALLEPQFPQQAKAATIDPNFAPINGTLLTALAERLDALAIGMGLSKIFEDPHQHEHQYSAGKDPGDRQSRKEVNHIMGTWVWEDAPDAEELLTNETLTNTETLVQEATSLDELEQKTLASDECSSDPGPDSGPGPGPGPTPGDTTASATFSKAATGTSGSCGGSASGSMPVAIITARDPNEKVGASGLLPQHFVTGLDPMRYAIYFENVATATAPAQEVHITDQLDVSTLDLATFELGPIHFGENVVVTPPPGLRNWTTDIDLRPSNNLIVRVTAGLDQGSGLVTWSFISLDPATMQPTEDPEAGFLPPNQNPPEGDGGVAFTIKAKPGLGEGTEIRNKARIVFDKNAPIDTGEWLNTIDNAPPASSVTALAATHASSAFEVKWSGSDSASGIAGYSIYVSENGGAYILWLANTTLTSAVFQGRPGASYSFYSVAQDGAGHSELPPLPGDAFTTTLSGQLLNIATRMKVETGDNVLIGGLIVSGTDPKRVIIRAIGPSLSQVLDGALADPVLELYQGDTLLASNDNWQESQQAEIEATTIPPTDESESAIVYDLAPGSYTAVMSGKDGGTGIGVIEAYDLDQAANSKLANISSRGFVQSGDDVMIGGLIAGGNGGADTRVLIRAIGPSLASAGIADALQDPTLELRDANGELLIENDNWQGFQQGEIEATTIPPANAAESAIVATLLPGNYTAIVRGKNDTSGVGVVEVYNLP